MISFGTWMVLIVEEKYEYDEWQINNLFEDFCSPVPQSGSFIY